MASKQEGQLVDVFEERFRAVVAEYNPAALPRYKGL
jgi:hypothetical protein